MTVQDFTTEFLDSSPYVRVQTSGSTGKPKQMLVEKARMLASARMTCDFLNLRKGDKALLCMSLDYIAAKMMVVRTIERELDLIEQIPSGHPLNSPETDDIDFLAIVPLQLYNTLTVEEETNRLKRITNVIVGGGAIDADIEARLRSFPNAVWSTYGMTETLSHIAMRRLSGNEASEYYAPLPDISLSQDADGCLVIDAPLLCAERLFTNDIVELLPDHRFRVLGRRDNVICSGGVKLQIEQIETFLKPYLSAPYIVTKAPDAKFGEIVVLLTEGDELETIAICEQIPWENKYARPKKVKHVEAIPLTETGKPARAVAAEMARY